MRSLRALGVAFACLLLPIAAQAAGLRSVATSDGIDAIVVGESGAIIRTLDSGNFWNDHSIGGSDTLEAVARRQLTMLVVGTNGTIRRSTTGGGGWVTTTVPGGLDLHDVAIVNATSAFAAGDGGTIWKSVNDGVSWSPLSSTTGAHLRALKFTSANDGWAVGAGGAVVRTMDGGTNWFPTPLGTSNDLLDVDQAGSVVWIVGRRGTAYKSTDWGASFLPVNLKLDAESDVNVVHMQGPDTLWLAGGGGFIRYSTNGGATWTFQQHRMHYPIVSMTSVGAKVFAVNNANEVVMWTSDRGAFWRFPGSATFARSWVGPKLTALNQVRGNTINYLPRFKRFYCALGNRIYRSYDLGETWTQIDTMASAYTKCNAFIVSPKDTNLMIAAVAANTGGAPDRLIRSTNGGADWTIVMTHDFGEYGIPLEMHPDKPDTLYFGGEIASGGVPPDQLYRSLDFGATWSPYSNAVFRSPCDIMVVPDTNIVLVGDGITGSGAAQFFRSTDGGQFFASTLAASASEIPTIAVSRLRPSYAIATNWDVGGTYRTQNYGSTWTKVDLTTSPWGVDYAKDDPNLVLFGQYVGNFSYISVDGGTMWSSFAVPGSFGNNNALYARDRNLVLALQSSGVWKMKTDYFYAPPAPSQTLTLTIPNGGEVWSPGQSRSIHWVAGQTPTVRLEYRRAPGEPWQFIADVPGYLNSYAWSVPNDAGTEVKFRVSDAWDATPMDSSNAVFTITGTRLVSQPTALNFGATMVGAGTGLTLTLVSDGTTTVNVTGATTGTPRYVVSRTTLTIPAGTSDTISVWFQPPSSGTWPDTLRITSNDAAHSPLAVPLSGSGVGPSITLQSPAGGEVWQYNSEHDISWTSVLVSEVDLDYRIHPDSVWVPITAHEPSAGSYSWTIPFDPTTTAQVRARASSGGTETVSPALRLTSPLLDVTPPDTLRMTAVVLGSTGTDTLWFENFGDAPLAIQSISTPEPEFWFGTTSLVVPAEDIAAVTVFYAPGDEGRDTALVTIVADDPIGEHQVAITGFGASSTASPVARQIPVEFALAQNRPNPFSRTTTIRYALPVESNVSLEVFDLNGHHVATLARGSMAAGQYTATFGSGVSTAAGDRLGVLSSGVYFVRLQAGPFHATRKMLLVR